MTDPIPLTQIILTGLMVGSIAAITLSVNGIESMYNLHKKAFEETNKKFITNALVKRRLEFKVLEYTFLIVLFFSLSEILTVGYLFLSFFITEISNLVLISGLVFFLIGIVATIFLYGYLRLNGTRKIPIRTQPLATPEIKKIEEIFPPAPA